MRRVSGGWSVLSSLHDAEYTRVWGTSRGALPAAFRAVCCEAGAGTARRLRWDKRMHDRAKKPDGIEQADAACRNPPTLGGLVADLEPLRPDESFDIPDITDKEWQEFVAALNG